MDCRVVAHLVVEELKDTARDHVEPWSSLEDRMTRVLSHHTHKLGDIDLGELESVSAGLHYCLDKILIVLKDLQKLRENDTA